MQNETQKTRRPDIPLSNRIGLFPLLSLKHEFHSESDIDEIISIETDCGLSSFGKSGYQNLISNSNSILITAKANDSNVLCGFFSGYVVVDELQIDNIAVSEKYRKKGIACLLLNEALNLAMAKGAQSAVLEVRSGNFPARKLYEQNGFEITGRRKNYYHDPTDDALILCRSLPQFS